MQYCHQIASAINTSIKATLNDNRFKDSVYFGIATLVQHEDRIQPMLTDNHDVNRIITPDNSIPLQIYHRTISISRTSTTTTGFGDANSEIKETTSMAMIAIATRKLLRLTPEELEAAIIASMPAVLTPTTRKALKLKSCSIKPTTSNLDAAEVYLQETKSDKFELQPNSLMLRINYSIECTYNRACFQLCDC